MGTTDAILQALVDGVYLELDCQFHVPHGSIFKSMRAELVQIRKLDASIRPQLLPWRAL
jgi:hypothetical protein